jgi:hypothetical protein
MGVLMGFQVSKSPWLHHAMVALGRLGGAAPAQLGQIMSFHHGFYHGFYHELQIKERDCNLIL